MKNIHLNMNEFTNASRVLKQVKSLSENKVFDKITILALGSEKLPEHESIANNIELYRINLVTRDLPKKTFFQAIKYIEFLFKSVYLIHQEKPDVLNVHSLSLLPIGVISKKLTKSLLIYDAHELETEKNGLFGIRKKIGKITEKALMPNVDMLLVVSDSISDWYSKEYKIKKPPVVLNAPKKRLLKKNNYFRNKLGIREDQTIFLYQGGLMHGRGIELLLESFKARSDDKAIIIFMGYGVLESNIKSAAKTHSNIFFFPAVPPDEVLEYTSSADIGVSLIEAICLSYYYCMPNKLFEYSMAGLPVLASNMLEMRKIIERYKSGVIVKELTIKDINTAIDRLLQEDIKNMKDNAYKMAVDHSWDKQELKMLEAYQTLINRL